MTRASFTQPKLSRLILVLAPNLLPQFGVMTIAAQASVQKINGEPTCVGCEIEHTLVATIHDRDFPEGALVLFAHVNVTSDTLFFVADGGPFREKLFFADRSGAIKDRVGDTGDGPGEYRSPRFVAESLSSYLVFDNGSGRITWLSKTDLEVQSTVLLPGPLQGVPIVSEGGEIVLPASIRSRESVGFPLHALSPTGEVLESFGPLWSPGTEDPIGDIAFSRDGAVWVARLYEYRLEKWGLNGELLAVYERDAPWYKPRPAAGSENEQLEPGVEYTYIDGLYEDEDGRLWIHASLVTSAGAGRIDPDPERNASIVEVLDPSEGVSLAYSRSQGVRASSTFGRGFFRQVRRESALGLAEYEIWGSRLRLERSPPFD